MKPNKTHNEIRHLGPHDVLLGRGTGPNESIGNIRFRESIRVIVEHSGIRKLDRPAKADLATLIVARIKEIGGKFVKKVNLGKASETAKGPSLESVYEEVCDAVACAKVKQCIRHQLSRGIYCRSTEALSLTRPTTPPCKEKQAWLLSSDAISTNPRSPFQQPTRSPALSPAISAPPRSPFQQPTRSPAVSPAEILSKLLSSPSDASYRRSQGQSEDSFFASRVDSQRQRESSLATTSADSQPQAYMTKEPLSTLHRGHGHSLHDHVASTPGPSILQAMLLPPQVSTNVNKDLILKKLRENQEQELALLREVMIVRGNKKLLEEQSFLLVTDQKFLASPMGMLDALLVREMEVHRSKFPSANRSMFHRPSLATPRFF